MDTEYWKNQIALIREERAATDRMIAREQSFLRRHSVVPIVLGLVCSASVLYLMGFYSL